MAKRQSADAPAIASWLFFGLSPIVGVAGAMAAPPLLAICALIGAPWKSLQAQFAHKSPALWALAAFLAWASLSSLWSPFPEKVLWLKLWAIALSGLAFAWALGRFAQTQPALAQRLALAAAIALAALLSFEHFSHYALNKLDDPKADDWEAMRMPSRGVSYLSVTLWGAAALAITRLRSWSMLIFAALWALTLWLAKAYDRDAIALAGLAAMLVYLAAHAAPRLVLSAIMGAAAATLLAAPLIYPPLMRWIEPHIHDQSWLHRLRIWRLALSHIQAAPLIGEGLDASRVIEGVPLHPHAAALQIWLETGAIGAVLLAAAMLLALRAALRTLRTPAMAALAAGLCAYLVQAMLSYGVWQERFIVSAIVLAACCWAARAFIPSSR